VEGYLHALLYLATGVNLNCVCTSGHWDGATDAAAQTRVICHSVPGESEDQQ